MLPKLVTVATLLVLSEIAVNPQTFTLPVLPGEAVVRAKETDRTTFVMGLRMSEEFDDNAVNDNLSKQGSLVTVLEPHVGWTLSGSRKQWNLDFLPGFSKGYPASVYDSRSQLFDTAFQIAPTRKLRIRLRESFLRSKNVFDQLRQSELAAGSSVLDRPNNSVVAASRENNEQVSGDLTYALNRRTSFGVSGAFYAVGYKSAVDDQELNNTRSIGTHVFLSYRSSKHNLSGLDYNIQDLVSDYLHSRALVQSFLYTDTVLIARDTSISFFAGPERSILREVVALPSLGAKTANRSSWSWSGGANFARSGTRTTLAVGVSRRISNGAGLQGIVQLSSATAEMRRQLTRQWKGRLLVAADRNNPLGTNSDTLSYLSVAGGLSRALSQRLSLDFQYWHMHQSNSSAQTSTFLANHNRVSMSVVYDFKAPLQK